jgi:Cu/Ag efflux protein CusF
MQNDISNKIEREETPMKGRWLVLFLVAALVLPAMAQAAKPSKSVSETTKWTGTVTAVDPATRTVTLQGPEGNTRTVECGPQVKNFAQIKVGDNVHVQYTEAMVVSVSKPGESVGATESATLKTAKPGEKPAMHAERTQEIQATVESIDPATRWVTLKGPQGNALTFKVANDVNLEKVKTGDVVVAKYTEALAIKVTPGTEKAKK